MEPRIVKLGLIEMDIAWEDRRANLEKAEKLIEKAASETCGIAVLPEMFTTGFSMNVPCIAEEEEGETFRFLSDLSKKYDINIIAGYAVKGDGNRAKNMAFAFDRKGGCVARYAKLYPFSHAGEHRHFDAGENPVVFELDVFKASVFICYDLRFPEAMRPVAPDVEAIFVIANWPSSRIAHFTALLRARAIENQCFAIGVNRTGTDGAGIEYPGGSAVFDPLGDAVSISGKGEFLTATIDPDEVKRVREKFPFLGDMRR